jgi:DNA-binding GntR family transcriptional regulator
VTQEETVYQYIEKAILEHRLLPGTRLREVQLAEIFGVKRGLIRKVLTRLTHAKLVDHQPNAGAQVACPSIEDAQDLFYTRQVLESAVLKILCERITPPQIEYLRDLLQQEHDAYQQQNPQLGVRLSAGFHRELVQLCGNRVLAEFLNEIINRTPFVIMSHPGDGGTNACINHEHSDIVDALEAGDFTRTDALMRQHLDHMQKMFHSHPARSETPLEEVFDL